MDGISISGSAQKFLDTGKVSGGMSTTNTSIGNASKSEDGKSFSDTLKDAISNVNEAQKSSDVAMQKLATGKSDNVADTMITAEKADIALRLMMQVRNKMIEAYQEVMKMQV